MEVTKVGQGRIIHRVKQSLNDIPRRKRVAAYCRVSTDKASMLHSLSQQISYYNEHIQKHTGWEYAGVYVEMLTPSLIQMHPTCTQIAP